MTTPPHLAGLDRFRVVLCNPDSSFNIGAVCRAMKTMGLHRLTIAGRILNDDHEKVRFMAVHALDIFEKAERYSTLHDALEDTAFSVGVTRRKGKNRKMSSFLPEDFAAHALRLQPGTIAVVFGNEEHGLTTEELSACMAAVHIPSSPEFPSLNLSHAVQVVSYALFRMAAILQYGKPFEAEADDISPLLYAHERVVNHRELDGTVDVAIDALTSIGFFRISESEPTRIFLRDILGRAGLSPRELVKMTTIFRKIRHIEK